MSFIVNPQIYNYSINQTGLVMNLDAANIKSYLPFVPTWTDLTGNGNNGGFGGSGGAPTYYRGGIDFRPAFANRILLTNNASTRVTEGTLGTWVKVTGSTSGYSGIVVKRDAWGLFLVDNFLGFFSWGAPAGFRTTEINAFDSQWRYVTLTFSQTTGTPSNNTILYVNGNSTITGTTKNVNVNAYVISVGWGNYASQYLNGTIGEVHLYNRVLTPSEVLYNFNTTRWRYGV